MRTLITSRVPIYLGIVFLGIYAALGVFMKIHVVSTRFVGSEDLLAELAEASFVEEPTPTTTDWPQWLGARRDGITTMPGLVKSWPERGPNRLWRKSSRDSYSSFAVAGGRAYTVIAENDGEAVVCWTLATGDEVWKRPYVPRRQFDYGGPRSTPTLDGDRLFVFTAAGVLLCLDAAKGEVLWQHDLVKELDASPPRWGFACSPLIEGDLVFLATGGSRGRNLAAFHKVSGDLVWTSQDDLPGYSSPVAATIEGKRQVIFLTGNRVVGIQPSDGTLLWEYPWNTSFNVNAATPLVFSARSGDATNTYVFVSTGYDRGCGLIKIERRGEGFLARRVYESGELCCHFSTPIRHRDHVYGLDEKRDLTCMNLRTGQVRWRFNRPQDAEGIRAVGFKKGSLIRIDEVLLVLGDDGKLALVEATPEAYREIVATRPFRQRCWTIPVLAEGKLLIRDLRQILCLDVQPGSVKH